MKQIFLILMLFYCFSCFSQEKIQWTYPIVPGTEAWYNLSNHQEKVNVCQIPEDILRTLGTQQLVELCLDYPLLMDIYAFNKMSAGFDAFYSNFNGIRELVKRKDAVEKLSALYLSRMEEQKSILNNSVIPLIAKGEYKFNMSTIEIFMGCPQMQSNLSEKQQKEVLSLLMKGYEKKYESLSEFKGIGFHANAYSRANIIQKMDASLFKNKRTARLVDGVERDVEAIEELNAISNQLIKK